MGDVTAGAIDPDRRTFEAIPRSAHAARQFVTETLRQHGASNKVIGDYALAVSELATNVIEHGDGSGLTICIDASDPLWWEVEVAGGAANADNSVLHPNTWSVAGAEQASGRGLGIVRHLMDHVVADTTDGRVSIRCRRHREDVR
jgi:anti-sigma regulatory factor (Ser/Thr protein kinase)